MLATPTVGSAPYISGAGLFELLSGIEHPQPWPGPTAASTRCASILFDIDSHLGGLIDSWEAFLVLAPQSEVSAVDLAEAIATLSGTDRAVRPAAHIKSGAGPFWLTGATSLMIAVTVPEAMARVVFEIASTRPHSSPIRNLHRSALLPADVAAALAELPAHAPDIVAKLERNGLSAGEIEALGSSSTSKRVNDAYRKARTRFEAQQQARMQAPEVLAAFNGRSVQLTFSNRGRPESLWGTVRSAADGTFELDRGPGSPMPVPQLENLRGIRDCSTNPLRTWMCWPSDITVQAKRGDCADASVELSDIALRMVWKLTEEEISTLQDAAHIMAVAAGPDGGNLRF